MKKIMFNDKFGLTDAVMSGRKTVTRRIKKSENLPYKVGEIVAVAQSYGNILGELENPVNYCNMGHWDSDSEKRSYYASQIYHPGFSNKMFVGSDLMPHQIEIIDVRAERLQDISDEDCFKEGVKSRTEFATLIDKISGKGIWKSNPFIWRIEFKLVK